MREQQEKMKANKAKQNGLTAKARLAGFLAGDMEEENDPLLTKSSLPIADLFPETTICFMDLAGFTRWSSAREPSQVFVLLETLFAAFGTLTSDWHLYCRASLTYFPDSDSIAHKHKIYKVETIGDCWVGVSGLPVPRDDRTLRV